MTKNNDILAMLNDLSEQDLVNQLAVQLHNIAKQLQLANLLEVVKLTDEQLKAYTQLVKDVTNAD